MDITDTRSSPQAVAAVTELYVGHALGLVRLAVLLVGDRASAEDIVQDALLGLYRRWDSLPGTSAPLAYSPRAGPGAGRGRPGGPGAPEAPALGLARAGHRRCGRARGRRDGAVRFR